MLHEFIGANRQLILSRIHLRLTARPQPLTAPHEIDHGAAVFLAQLCDTLRWEATDTPVPTGMIGSSGARHGRELLAAGFNLGEVVHDYGDICQAVTELALESQAPITTEEFHTLNRCLDTAIAEAVNEHGRIAARAHANEEIERLGQVAHEVRDILNTAVFAFEILKRGTAPVDGSTGAVLGRSLLNLRDFIDTTLSDIRLSANQHRRTNVRVTSLVSEIGVATALHAQYREVVLRVDGGDPDLTLIADEQLLRSAVMNLVNNAVKFTHAGGDVVLRARREGAHVLIEVEDECGGIPDTKSDVFQPFGDRRGRDRSGLGLGLSIARRAARAHGGDILVRNLPGKGCIFTIDLPLDGADHAAAGRTVPA